MKTLLQMQNEFINFIRELDNEYYLFVSETNDLSENDTYRIEQYFDNSKIYLGIWYEKIDSFNEDYTVYEIEFDRNNVANDELVKQLLKDILTAVKEDIDKRLDIELTDYKHRIQDLNLNKSFIKHLED